MNEKRQETIEVVDTAYAVHLALGLFRTRERAEELADLLISHLKVAHPEVEWNCKIAEATLLMVPEVPASDVKS